MMMGKRAGLNDQRPLDALNHIKRIFVQNGRSIVMKRRQAMYKKDGHIVRQANHNHCNNDILCPCHDLPGKNKSTIEHLHLNHQC